MNPQPIILAGGSGFLGKVLADYFAARGMEVVILTRNPRSRVGLIRDVHWDGATVGDWLKELEGARAIINLVGISVNCRYHARNRKLLLDSRPNSLSRVGAWCLVDCSPKASSFSTRTCFRRSNIS